MKTLILNGSPRIRGDTAGLIKVLKKTLQGEIIELSAYYDKVSPCIDCRDCWKTGECSIKDKMDIIYDDDFDNIIIASPLYISGLTGPLISLASRLQVYYASKHFLGKEKNLRKKKGVLILVGGGDGTHKRAISYAQWICGSLNATLDNDNMAFSLNTNELPAALDVEAINKVKEIADRLNKSDIVRRGGKYEENDNS